MRSILPVLLVAALAGCGGSGDSRSCAPVDDGVIPEWARGGFSDAEPKVPHVLSDDGTIVAILFGGTLEAPPSRETSNKILWVPREPLNAPTQLKIRAQAGAGDVVDVTLPNGPGPSGVDLPHPGCWRLTLHWAGHTDTMSLRYVPA